MLMIFLICSMINISVCDARNHSSVAGITPFGIIDYSGYLIDDFYYTYYPHDYCKHIDIYIGTKLSVTKNESINGFVKVILENRKIVWIKEKYITKDIMYTEYKIGDNGNKRYMDWECITDTTSNQYKLQTKSYTGANGVRMINGRYCIALGSYFTTDIGTKIDVLLQSEGNLHIVRCVLGDCKADIDTDSSNIYMQKTVVLLNL